MNDEQNQKYNKIFLSELSRSISRKLSLVQVLVSKLRLEIYEVNRILKADKEGVDNCIKIDRPYSFGRNKNIYLVIVYIEAALIELKSAVDLTIKYISKFCTHVVLNKKKESVVLKELEDRNINMRWRHELDHIRHGFIHHYSGWVSLNRHNNIFKPMIDLPKSIKRWKAYKKFPYDRISIEKINEILIESQKFFQGTCDYLLEKIQKLS